MVVMWWNILRTTQDRLAQNSTLKKLDLNELKLTQNFSELSWAKLKLDSIIYTPILDDNRLLVFLFAD